MHDAVDLCLACKACSSDCPAQVDMAAYKAKVLYRTLSAAAATGGPHVLGRLLCGPGW